METAAGNAKKRTRPEDTSEDRKKRKGTNFPRSWTAVLDLSGSPSDDTDVDATSYSSVVFHAQHGNHLVSNPWNAYPHTYIQPQQAPLVQPYAPPYSYNYAPNYVPGMSAHGAQDNCFPQTQMYPSWPYPTHTAYQALSYPPYLAPEYTSNQSRHDGLPNLHWTNQHYFSGLQVDTRAMNLNYQPLSQQNLANKENNPVLYAQSGKQAASQANANTNLVDGWQSTTQSQGPRPSPRPVLQERKNLQNPAPPAPMSRDDRSCAPDLPKSENTSASEKVQPLLMTICNCRRTDLASTQKEITCANTSCKVGRYHAICVGLAKRDPAPDWKCRDCRQQPLGSTPASSQVIPQVPSGPTEPSLSVQQQTVVDLILRGRRNVCYTGSAGTGKSTVLKAAVGC